MKNRRFRVALFALFLLVALCPAGARARNLNHSLTLSPMAGGYRFEGNQGIDIGRFYSLGLGYNLNKRWGIEGVAEFVDSEFENGGTEVRLYGARLDALYHFHPQGPFVPYLIAGLGAAREVSDVPGTNVGGVVTSGLGLKLFLNDFIALRVEARHVLDVDIDRDLKIHGVFNNFAYGGGLSFQFGGGAAAPAPRDADGDGVIDSLDRCPATLSGTPVGFDGCPGDSDSDGVADSLDRCADTPAGILVDGSGCPKMLGVLDSDGDGIADDSDFCPATPHGTPVDEAGCPKTIKWVDSDGDGVADTGDDCPGTPTETVVDPRGCPQDSDGDGVYDVLDRCPGTPLGSAVDDRGCESSSLGGTDAAGTGVAEVEIEYLRGEAEFSAKDAARLQGLADYLVNNPQARLVVEGHTDSVGPAAFNLQLSLIRAEKVRRALIERHGVSAGRVEARGFGESLPQADNSTPEGRQKNRRVLIRLLR